MDTNETRHVLSAEKIDDGVIISFDNGRCALYPANLLFSMIGSAQEVNTDDDAQWPPEQDALGRGAG